MTINVYKNGMELVTNIDAEDFLFDMNDSELEVVLNKLDNCCNKISTFCLTNFHPNFNYSLLNNSPTF